MSVATSKATVWQLDVSENGRKKTSSARVFIEKNIGNPQKIEKKWYLS
jgi:hypothetical protein